MHYSSGLKGKLNKFTDAQISVFLNISALMLHIYYSESSEDLFIDKTINTHLPRPVCLVLLVTSDHYGDGSVTTSAGLQEETGWNRLQAGSLSELHGVSLTVTMPEFRHKPVTVIDTSGSSQNLVEAVQTSYKSVSDDLTERCHLWHLCSWMYADTHRDITPRAVRWRSRSADFSKKLNKRSGI